MTSEPRATSSQIKLIRKLMTKAGYHGKDFCLFGADYADLGAPRFLGHPELGHETARWIVAQDPVEAGGVIRRLSKTVFNPDVVFDPREMLGSAERHPGGIPGAFQKALRMSTSTLFAASDGTITVDVMTYSVACLAETFAEAMPAVEVVADIERFADMIVVSDTFDHYWRRHACASDADMIGVKNRIASELHGLAADIVDCIVEVNVANPFNRTF